MAVKIIKRIQSMMNNLLDFILNIICNIPIGGIIYIKLICFYDVITK